MRLWHFKLLSYLPKSQVSGLHREICAMRGLGWSKKHRDVNYVFQYNYKQLFSYHRRVFPLLNVADPWKVLTYRGKNLGFVLEEDLPNISKPFHFNIYPEHDDNYLILCLHNLKYALKENKKEMKNIDLFRFFPEIEDEGFYEKDVFYKRWQTSLKRGNYEYNYS